MATYYARVAGNINATNVWSTTPTGATSDLFPSFTSGDVLMANNFTVTINVNTTVAEIRMDSANGATMGGQFNLNDNVTLTASIFTGSSLSAVIYSGNTTATIVGNITGGSNANIWGAVLHNGNGILNIIGNITGGTGGSHGGFLTSAGSGTTNITGNIFGGTSTTAYGVRVSALNQTLNITGTVTGSNTTSSNVGVFLTGGTVNVVGTVVGGNVAAGASNTSAGILTVRRAKGNGFGNGSAGLSAAVGVISEQSSLTRVYEIEYGDLGQSPTSGPVFLFPSSTNVALFYRPSTSKKTLISGDSILNVFPNASDVRKNISFNAGNSVGTMSVPPAQSVASGVPVDNTTGTAVLTIDDISKVWDVPVSSISVSGSIGERLKNCSTVATMGQQLAQAFSNIN